MMSSKSSGSHSSGQPASDASPAQRPHLSVSVSSAGWAGSVVVVELEVTATDVDGTIAAVTVTSLPPATEGVLYLADGTTPVVAGTPLTPAEAAALVFVPAANFNGTVTIAFTVTAIAVMVGALTVVVTRWRTVVDVVRSRRWVSITRVVLVVIVVLSLPNSISNIADILGR